MVADCRSGLLRRVIAKIDEEPPAPSPQTGGDYDELDGIDRVRTHLLGSPDTYLETPLASAAPRLVGCVVAFAVSQKTRCHAFSY
jgi:hypothetical protein